METPNMKLELFDVEEISAATRRTHTPAFEAPGGRGYRTLADLAKQFEGRPNQITEWKRQLLERAANLACDATG